MRLQLAQRLADYEVTRPPLGRCTRSGRTAIDAWSGLRPGEDDPLLDDGLVVDLADDPLPPPRSGRGR